MKKPTLYMLIGLPASGKSTVAQQLNAVVHSSDSIREEFNNELPQDMVFEELHHRVQRDLRRGLDVVYDATNIHHRYRKQYLATLDFDCKKVAILVLASMATCISRNSLRSKPVPSEVLYRMYNQFEVPLPSEGFDDIQLYWSHQNTLLTVWDFVKQAIYFNQDNYHHTLTLGDHCLQTMFKVGVNAPLTLKYAALLHDEGKVFTKSFDENGVAHYYNHDNVGAYNSFFYETLESDEDKLEIARLINYHMLPYSNITTKRMLNKLGTDLYNSIMLLHAADEEAH